MMDTNRAIKVFIYIAVFAACHLLMTSCDSNARKDSAPLIAVSIEPMRNILEQIAGDRYDIITVLERGDNPETFEPSMQKRVAVDRCKAYFTIGAFAFEDAFGKSSDSLRIFDTADGIKRIYGTHNHSHHDRHNHSGDNNASSESAADPHVWTSLKNARIIAANMADALTEIDPDNAATYRSNLKRYYHHIDSIDSALTQRFDSLGAERAFAVWHPSLSYFARDYGLTQISVGQESKEVSPLKMREIIDDAVADSVHVFFFQREFDSRQAQSISERIGSRLIEIDPLTYDWESQINLIADEIMQR